jgi:hypothetical protein
MDTLELIHRYGQTPQETEDGLYELPLEDEGLTVEHLMDLNLAGYVYHSEVTGVDFEDLDPEGNTITRYMDIYYFTLIEQ